MYTPEEMEWLSTESIALNNHEHGVSPHVSIKSFTHIKCCACGLYILYYAWKCNLVSPNYHNCYGRIDLFLNGRYYKIQLL